MASSGAGAHVTVRAIAAEAGVSIATVSRVMNGNPLVAPGTREAVQRAVQRLGAAAPPRPAAATGAVYVRCPYVLTDYFAVIVSSIAETLDLHHRRLVLGVGETAEGAHVLAGLPRDPSIAGAILILPPESDEDLDHLRTAGLPFVVVDPRTSLPREVASVSAAHFAGARSITAHLTGLGHRRIGVITGPPEWHASHARLVGHTSALAETGTLPDPDLVRSAEPAVEGGHRAAGELLDLPDRPTALVGFNDKAAVGAMRAAHERGLRIPEDLSITGFDDSELGRCSVPPLTTVRQPLAEMGRIAVSVLIRLLARHTVDTLHIELATQLVVRDTTAPPPGTVLT